LAYYNFSRYQESLRIPVIQPVDRRRQPHPQKYRERTPAEAAGLSDRHWTVPDLISYPMP